MIAEEDWKYAVEGLKTAPPLAEVYGAQDELERISFGVVASVELYLATRDDRYAAAKPLSWAIRCWLAGAHPPALDDSLDRLLLHRARSARISSTVFTSARSRNRSSPSSVCAKPSPTTRSG